MKSDISEKWFAIFHESVEKNVTLVLKNGRKVSGRIGGHIRPDGSTKYNNEPDFKFIVIEKFLSVENEFQLKDGILLNSYFFLKQKGLSDELAFGLDKSDVVVEHIPLVYQPIDSITF